MPMHPQVVAFLERMAPYGFKPTQELTPEQARAQFDEGVRLRAIPVREIGAVENRTIPGPAGNVPVRIYRPEGDGPHPALLYFHGGGHVVGTLDAYDSVARALCIDTPCIVVSVDYRLAPEHKFPAAAEDCFAALEWVAANGRDLGVDTTRLAVGGDSAGGNLAAVAALMARDAGAPALALQLLVYPVADYACDTPSYTAYAKGFGPLQAESMHWYRGHYLRGVEDRLDWRAAPLRAPDVAGVAPACVLTAELDVLRDEGVLYRDKLVAAGVPAEHREYAGMIHGFFAMAPILDAASEAQHDAAAALASAFAG